MHFVMFHVDVPGRASPIKHRTGSNPSNPKYDQTVMHCCGRGEDFPERWLLSMRFSGMIRSSTTGCTLGNPRPCRYRHPFLGKGEEFSATNHAKCEQTSQNNRDLVFDLAEIPRPGAAISSYLKMLFIPGQCFQSNFASV